MTIEHRPEEQAILQERALKALEMAHILPPLEIVSQRFPLLRLWRYPTFESYKSWTLFRAREEGPLTLVRAVTWEQLHDLQRFTDPLEGIRQGFQTPPTIHVHDAFVSTQEMQHYLEELAVPILPVVNVAGLAIDGERCGVETFEGAARFSLEWWNGGPSPWNPFITGVVHLRQFLQNVSESE